MRIADHICGRDNNYNLIRIVAAYAVLVTHSFALTGRAEPFSKSLGMTMGSMAVDVFFLTSGFLVTASLLTRQSAVEFVWARVLRIMPALFVMLSLTVFCLGACFTTLSLSAYFADSEVYKYFFKGLTLFSGVSFQLPGVFESNPHRASVNGSLWTLPYEVQMYGILALLWLALRYLFRAQTVVLFRRTIAGATTLAGVWTILQHGHIVNVGGIFVKLFYMFFTGACFYMFKERIVLSRRVFGACAMALAFSAVNRHTFFLVYVLTLAYLLFYCAYVPSGMVRKYNSIGDYSYGVYIYAFPVQQSIAALWPGITVPVMLVLSSLFTLAVSVLSWYGIEKHALTLKETSVTITRRLLFACRSGARR